MVIGNGFGCWKTIVTRRRSSLTSSSCTSVPSSVISPLRAAPSVTSVSRFIERSSVVLPEPEAPINASTSPWRTETLTSRTTQLLPYASHTDSTRMRSFTCDGAAAVRARLRATARGAPAPFPAPAGSATRGLSIHDDAPHGRRHHRVHWNLPIVPVSPRHHGREPGSLPRVIRVTRAFSASTIMSSTKAAA